MGQTKVFLFSIPWGFLFYVYFEPHLSVCLLVCSPAELSWEFTSFLCYAIKMINCRRSITGAIYHLFYLFLPDISEASFCNKSINFMAGDLNFERSQCIVVFVFRISFSKPPSCLLLSNRQHGHWVS